MPRYSQRPAKEETINDPTVSKHYWRYRYRTKVGGSTAHMNCGLMDVFRP
jgi:hypothetical protein